MLDVYCVGLTLRGIVYIANTPPSPCLTVLLSKAACRMPDWPVEWQLLGNEMQLLNDISSLLNLGDRENERERVRWGEKGDRARQDHERWTPRQKAGRPPVVSPPGGDHHFRAALLHLPMLNRELIAGRRRSPGHREQQQSWLSSTSNSILACLFWMGCNPTGV